MQNSTQAANAWRILFLLFLANLFNFFDRTIPAIIIEPIRMEWHLSDFQLGIIGTAFTIVYAIAGLPLGRMADTGSRSKLMGWGLAAWSGLTAVNGLVGSFWSFLIVRMGIGIGEASYAPAANSLIGDLFPAHRRARAMGIFMLGLPLGLLLAFFTIGWMVKAFDSWRAPFFIAAVPGLILAVFMFFIKEPKRGAAESVQVSQETRGPADPSGAGGADFPVAGDGGAVLQLRHLCLQLVSGADAAALFPDAVAGRGSGDRGDRRRDRVVRPDARRLDCRQDSPARGQWAAAVRGVQPDHFDGVHGLGAAFRADRDRGVCGGVQSGLVVRLQLLYLRVHGDSGRGRAAPAGYGDGAVLCRVVSAGRWIGAGGGGRFVRSLCAHGHALGWCRADDRGVQGCRFA